MIEITMPRLSDTMEEGEISAWHKQPGDRVEVGDVLVEIETDKATMEYEAYEAGTLADILVPVGGLVPIGTPIATLDDGKAAPSAPTSSSETATEVVSAPSAASASETKSVHEAILAAAASAESTGSGPDDRVFASPLVRKMARENHLDLSQVHGTGPGGRIIRTDVDELLHQTTSVGASSAPSRVQAAALKPSGTSLTLDEKRGTQSVELSKARRVIARRLGESARTIPHYFVTTVADAEALVQLRGEMNAQLTATGRSKISINDFLIRACAMALREHPSVNASYVDDASTTMQVHQRINVGVAVASPNGLVVPVIVDADEKTVSQLGEESRQLAGLAMGKGLSLDQMSGGTFTISNLGMYGVEQFTAIINPPEGAILAVGATTREPVYIGDELVPRHRLRYTLSADHRIIDGALAAEFLRTLTQLIENPWSIVT